MMRKAEDFSCLHNLVGFKPSAGWFDRWKKRYNVSFQVMNGESEKVDTVIVENWIYRLSILTTGYDNKNIFNADETGLFFKCLPSKTLNKKGQKCYNGEKSNDRLTVLFCCSWAGEKLKPLVIGKSAKPRCFNGTNPNNFGAYYRSNRKA